MPAEKHQQCYQTYTSPKILATVEKQAQTVPKFTNLKSEELFSPRSSRSQVVRTSLYMSAMDLFVTPSQALMASLSFAKLCQC